MSKKRKFDRIKTLKKINRDETQPYGKAGVHSDKREQRLRHMDTQDWLDEAEDDEINHMDYMDAGPGEKLLDSEPLEEESDEQGEGDRIP